MTAVATYNNLGLRSCTRRVRIARFWCTSDSPGNDRFVILPGFFAGTAPAHLWRRRNLRPRGGDVLPESSQIRAVSGLLNVKSPLHFLALALMMLVPPLCLLFREPVIEAAGTRSWTAVAITMLLVYFGIFLGFLVLALRNPRLVTVDAHAGDGRPDPPAAPVPREESRAA